MSNHFILAIALTAAFASSAEAAGRCGERQSLLDRLSETYEERHVAIGTVTPSTAEDNHSYQRRLAQSLVQCLGRNGAVRACQANTWHGVLDVVLKSQNTLGTA